MKKSWFWTGLWLLVLVGVVIGNADEVEEEDMEAIHNPAELVLQWAKQHGGSFHNAHVEHDEVMGYKVIADRDLKVGSQLLKIPKQIFFGYEGMSKSKIGQILVKEVPNNWTALSLFFIYEKHMNPQSFWKPYIDFLPENLNSPHFWTKQQRKMMDGTWTGDLINSDLAEFRKIHEEIVKPLSEKYPNEFPAKHFTFRNLGLAWTVLWSRYFGQTGNLPAGLIPVACFLNSKETSDVTVEAKGDLFVMKAAHPIKKGDEIFYSYSNDKSNGLYLRQYGYIVPNNEKNFVALPIELDPNDPALDYKQEAVEHFDVSSFAYPHNYQKFQVTVDGFSAEIFTFLRIKHFRATKEHLESSEWPKFDQNLGGGEDKLGLAVLKDLGDILKNQLKRLPEPLKEVPAGAREQIAAQIVEEERTILTKAIEHVKSLNVPIFYNTRK